MYNCFKMHMELASNSAIPRSSCLCEVWKNTSLLAKGINSSLKSSYILSPTAQTHTHAIRVQRIECLEAVRNISSRNCRYLISKQKLIWSPFYNIGRKKIVKVNQAMPFGQVIPEWVETINNLKRHVYRKREQLSSYNKQKDELKTGEALVHLFWWKLQ